MRFRPGARLDPSQVEDRRGAGGMSLPGGGLAVGGGGLGIVGLAIYLLIAVLSNGSGGLSAPLQNLNDRSVGAQPAAGCTTARAANTREDCRIVGYVNSIQAYWTSQFRQSGRAYAISRTVFFDGSTPTGCGTATSDVGPFYCPVDKHVYIDLGFFDELRTRFGASGRPVRAGLRARPRVRAPRPGPARPARQRLRPGGRHGALRAHRAAGRLLRGRLGEPRGARPAISPT